jgi:uncharacterized repeat protein (TIGR01451 family)
MRRIPTLAAILLLLLVGTAAAQENIELTSRAETETVTVNAKGEKETVRTPAAKVVPGDTVIFTNSYRNAGREPATRVVIVNPVPEHMTYLEESATGEKMTITFSVDGGKSFAAADQLFLPGPDGKPRPARAEEYTHIRWTLPGALPPGASGEVVFRARLK